MTTAIGNALTKQWAFGFQNRTINGVQNLTDKDRNAIFYISSHSGVIYDFENRTQTILQGHRNIIKCCVVSKDKNFIVTCDSGEDPIIVIWDSRSGLPIKTIMNAHPNGIDSLDISDDCLFIVTLGTNLSGRQEVAVWAWSRDETYQENHVPNNGSSIPKDVPILTSEISENTDRQHIICFDRKNKLSIVSTGDESIIFWNWEEFHLEYYIAKVPKSEFGNLTGKFTCSLFLSGTNTAVTSTTDGHVVVWEPTHERGYGGKNINDNNDNNNNNNNKIHKKRSLKSASKVLKLIECGITTMTTTENNYLALGCSDGAVRFYDFYLRLESWFEDLQGGAVSSLSFSLERNPYNEKEAGTPGLKFWVPNFVIGTTDALVIGVDSNIFEELNAEDRRGVLLLQGFPGEISDLKCHPTRALAAFTCSDPGSLQIWNYDMKLLMSIREFNNLKDGNELSVKSLTSYNRSLRSHVSLKGGTLHSDMKKGFQPQCIAFEEQNGEILSIGFRNGDVKILNTETLQDLFTFCPSSDSILFLKFSSTGSFLAGYDTGNHTLLFKRSHEEGQPPNYFYIGRIKVHSSHLTGLTFGYKEGVEVAAYSHVLISTHTQQDIFILVVCLAKMNRIHYSWSSVLVSVGDDRRYCEYDLGESSIENGLLCTQADNKNTNDNEIKSEKTIDYRYKQNNNNNNNNNINNNSVNKNGNMNTNTNTSINFSPGKTPTKNIIQSIEKKKISNIEIVARPTAILWNPKINENDMEDRFIIANNEYKLKEFNADSQQCRKTTLGPVFSNYLNSNFQNNFNDNRKFDSNFSDTTSSTSISSPISSLIPITIDGKASHYGYSCSSRIIGLGSFPLTGNPSEVIGINAHPNLVSAISVSYDGKYFFSSGGSDLAAYMYEINLNNSISDMNNNNNNNNNNSNNLNNLKDSTAIESRTNSNSKLNLNANLTSIITNKKIINDNNNDNNNPIQYFLALLEGGENGDLHEDIIEYFYFCQLRAQGEESTDERTIPGEIPIDEIPSLMRAVGFYPSEGQVADMTNEVRYQNFMKTGVTQETINLSNFITLFVNHRPVLALNNLEIKKAFATIAGALGDGNEDANGSLPWGSIEALLLNEGENISETDLQSYLSALLGTGLENIPEHSTSYDSINFTENILGFES